MKTGSVTEFLNVDLDLRGGRDLETLLEHLGSSVIVLHQSPQLTVIEWARSSAGTSLERTVLAMAELIKSLPPKQATIWKSCPLRRFNIGIQAGDEPHSAEFALSTKAVSLLAKIGAEVWITVYAADHGSARVGAMPAKSQLAAIGARVKKRKTARKTGLANRSKRSR